MNSMQLRRQTDQEQHWQLIRESIEDLQAPPMRYLCRPVEPGVVLFLPNWNTVWIGMSPLQPDRNLSLIQIVVKRPKDTVPIPAFGFILLF